MKNHLLILISFLFPLSAFSASDLTPSLKESVNEEMRKPHLGFQAGASNPDGNYNSSGKYSVTYGFQPYIPISFGVEAGFANYTQDTGTFNRTSVLLKAQYNFGGTMPLVQYSYVGLGLGPAWEDSSANNDFGFALISEPNIGFDIPLRNIKQPLSLGLNLSLLTSSRATPDTVNISGVVKYWY